MNVKDTPWSDPLWETDSFFVFKDGFPVTKGHLLFVPKHDTPLSISSCLYAAYNHGEQMIGMGECEGFNVGMNVGESAGQTVMYPHIHLIPRRTGDMQDPRGGVRHVIPAKGNYKIDSAHERC